MQNYYVDEVKVIIDGNKYVVRTIDGYETGSSYYNPIRVKCQAKKLVEELYPNSKLVCEILSNKQVNLEQYVRINGSNPSWSVK